MAGYAKASISVGSLLSGAFETAKANKESSALFVVVLTVIGSVSDYLSYSSGDMSLGGGGMGIVLAVATIIAGYLLTEAMLSQSGQQTYRGGRRYFAYLGQTILVFLGVALGAVLLIIPGLILAARWCVAAPLLIGRGEGVTAAMRQSWDLTRGHTLSIVLTGLILLGSVIVLAGVVTLTMGEDGLAAIISLQLLSSLLSVIVTAMVVWLLDMLDSSSEALSEVFG